MSAPRRGRPPLGARKEILQVPLDPDDMALFERAVEAMGVTRAELGRSLIKGEVAWTEIERRAKSVKRK